MADYIDSCSQYMHYVCHPNPTLDCANWASEFTNWSAFQVFLYAFMGIVWVIAAVINESDYTAMANNFLKGLIIAYVIGHTGWFVVVRKDGLCHPATCLIMGGFYFVWGLQWLDSATNGAIFAHKFDATMQKLEKRLGMNLHPAKADELGEYGETLREIMYACYAVALLYMGVSAAMMYLDRGSRHRGLEMDDFADGEEGGFNHRVAGPTTIATESELVPLTQREDDEETGKAEHSCCQFHCVC